MPQQYRNVPEDNIMISVLENDVIVAKALPKQRLFILSSQFVIISISFHI